MIVKAHIIRDVVRVPDETQMTMTDMGTQRAWIAEALIIEKYKEVLMIMIGIAEMIIKIAHITTENLPMVEGRVMPVMRRIAIKREIGAAVIVIAMTGNQRSNLPLDSAVARSHTTRMKTW